MPPRPITEMEPAAIDREIANHERLKKTDLPRYAELVMARSERGSLSLERSRDHILKAARERRFVSYGDLAAANGVKWAATTRTAMSKHLEDLVAWGHAAGVPLLSATVVNQPNMASGGMEPETLRGFVASAQRLGLYDGRDPEVFLRKQQHALFDHVARGQG